MEHLIQQARAKDRHRAKGLPEPLRTAQLQMLDAKHALIQAVQQLYPLGTILETTLPGHRKRRRFKVIALANLEPEICISQTDGLIERWIKPATHPLPITIISKP